MKLKLSERLQMMAEAVGPEDVAADIGTDHGYIPIWLAQNQRCRQVILADINSGPLEKAKENIAKYLPGHPFDLRQGSGISVLNPGEADTVIIAGMGGNLILDILKDEPEKTMTISRFVLQPRNHPELLRRWVEETPQLTIRSERIAEEDGRLCEIIIIENISQKGECADADPVSEDIHRRYEAVEAFRQRADVPKDLAYELPLLYFTEQIPYAIEFLQTKIAAEERIIRRIEEDGISGASARRLKESRERLAAFRRVEACAAADFQKGEGYGRTQRD